MTLLRSPPPVVVVVVVVVDTTGLMKSRLARANLLQSVYSCSALLVWPPGYGGSMVDDAEWGGYVTGTASGSSAGDWSFDDDPDDDSWETYCDRSTWSTWDYATRGVQCSARAAATTTAGIVAGADKRLRLVASGVQEELDKTRDDLKEIAWMQVILALGLIAGAAYVLPSFAGTGFQIGRRR
jgi:hypothetical protein